MNDIERAIARLKVHNGTDSSQGSADNKDKSDVGFLVAANLFDVDIDIGVPDADFRPVAEASGEACSVATAPSKSGTCDNPEPKLSRNHSSRSIEVSRSHDLPLAALAKAGFITPGTRKSKITEEYRRIKRPLLKRLALSCDHEVTAKNVIAVTSAMAGEGKTFSAINLAMSLAREKDRTVLLIDADVVRHTTGELFGVSPEDPGLLDLLDSDVMDPSDVILKTNVERLEFLPAGGRYEHASELLSSDNMSRLISNLSSRNEERIIVVDCPPIMQTNEAAILVDHAGQIVFVVAEEKTSQGIVIQALRLIDDDTKVGILLNKSTTRLGHYDYYSYDYS